MSMKAIPVLIAAILRTIVPFAHAAPSATPQLVHESTQLLYPDGKPAVDATAIIDLIDVKTHKLTVYTAKPDSLGNVSITLPYTPYIHSFQVLYATSPTGIGFWTTGNSVETMPTIVQPFTSLRVHLVDSSGKPIAHTKIGPSRFRTDYCISGWHDTIPGPWSQSTDRNGNATLTSLPQGYELTLDVDDDRYALPDTRFPVLLANSAVTPDTTIQFSAATSVSGKVLFGQTDKPVAGISIYVSAPGYNRQLPGAITDSKGAFTVKRLPPGVYNMLPFDWSRQAYPDWVAQSQNVNATAGQATRITLNLVRGGTITGKVTDEATGKPISNIEVSASQDQAGPAQSKQITTGVDGAYSFHMLPGRVNVDACIPGMLDDGLHAKKVVVTDNETTNADFQFGTSAFPKTVGGFAFGPDGKPIAGAVVSIAEGYPANAAVKTDALGHFTFDSPGLLPKERIFACSGDLSTPSPVPFNGENQLTLHLTANDLCTLTGEVEDQNGTPIPYAPVLLFATTETWIPEAFTETDAKGVYIFPRVYSNIEYRSESNPPGYWLASCDPVLAVPNQTVRFRLLIVEQPNSFTGGTVLDADGNPVSNVRVSCEDHANSYTYTDQSGRFMLPRIPKLNITLRFQTRNDRPYIMQDVYFGHTDNIIHLPHP